MIRRDILVAAGVALIVSLAVTSGLPKLKQFGGVFRGSGGAVAGVLSSVPTFGVFQDATGVENEASGGKPVYCKPDIDGFSTTHDLEQDGWERLSEEDTEGLTETTILTPSRMNNYSLTENPEYFVGYFAQRGSFQSSMAHDVAHIEVLTTYILHNASIGRRNLVNAIRDGVGPTHGIFQISYEAGGKLMGEWSGRTDADGNIQGCFFFPPSPLNGEDYAGIGTYQQSFINNEASIVTWKFEAFYKKN